MTPKSKKLGTSSTFPKLSRSRHVVHIQESNTGIPKLSPDRVPRLNRPSWRFPESCHNPFRARYFHRLLNFFYLHGVQASTPGKSAGDRVQVCVCNWGDQRGQRVVWRFRQLSEWCIEECKAWVGRRRWIRAEVVEWRVSSTYDSHRPGSKFLAISGSKVACVEEGVEVSEDLRPC